MEQKEQLLKISKSVSEHIRAIREFKHDMFMRYTNTSSEDKRMIIVEKVSNIYQAMMLIHNSLVAEYNELATNGAVGNDTSDVKNDIDTFYEEVLSLR